MIRTPKPHQRRALGAIAESDAPRLQVVMACGTGKTCVAAWASLGHNGVEIDPTRIARTVVVLGPSIHIGAQSAKGDWLDAGRVATALVCSDDKALQGDETIEADERMEGVPVTTSADELTSILSGRDEWTLFGTYASGDRIGRALHTLGISADLVIYDEAHRVAGPEDKATSALLYDETLPAKRRLFFTATPRVSGRGQLTPHGMDNVDLFGDDIYRLSTGQAIVDKLIADYRVKCVRVPDGTDVKNPHAVTKALHFAVANAIKSGEIRNAFMFRHEIERCEESARLLTDLGIFAVVVHGGQSIRERERLIRDVIARGGVAVTDKALAEGINAPDVDAVVFMDRKTSLIDIVQGIGRCLRNGGNRNKIATIVVPFVTANDGVVEVTGMLGYLLDALRHEDPRLEDCIKAAVRAAVRGEPREREWSEAHGLGDTLDGKVGEAVLRDTVGAPNWHLEERIEQVKLYHAEHGRLPRGGKAADNSEEKSLGAFLVFQRARYKLGLVSPDTVESMESIPTFTWDPMALMRQARAASPADPLRNDRIAVTARLKALNAIGDDWTSSDTIRGTGIGVNLTPMRRLLDDGMVERIRDRNSAGHGYLWRITPAGESERARLQQEADQESMAAK